jgi:dTMP kinase
VTLKTTKGPGVFIAFEGGEGSGKSTQIHLLAQALPAFNPHLRVRTTYEPGATPVGRQIRDLVLHNAEPLAPRAEALLFAADRAHHVATVVRPAMAAGEWVLTDRYIDSSLAYQGVGRDLDIDEVRRISLWATDDLVPDLTFLFDVPADVGLARVAGRGRADKVEAESLEFHNRVRQAFLDLAAAEPRRYVVLDATGAVEDIAAEVWQAVSRMTVNL